MCFRHYTQHTCQDKMNVLSWIQLQNMVAPKWLRLLYPLCSQRILFFMNEIALSEGVCCSNQSQCSFLKNKSICFKSKATWWWNGLSLHSKKVPGSNPCQVENYHLHNAKTCMFRLTGDSRLPLGVNMRVRVICTCPVDRLVTCPGCIMEVDSSRPLQHHWLQRR